MASHGHSSTHAPQSPHVSPSTTATPSSLSSIASNGHTSVHAPQPVHFSLSIIAAIPNSPFFFLHSHHMLIFSTPFPKALKRYNMRKYNHETCVSQHRHHPEDLIILQGTSNSHLYSSMRTRDSLAAHSDSGKFIAGPTFPIFLPNAAPVASNR